MRTAILFLLAAACSAPATKFDDSPPVLEPMQPDADMTLQLGDAQTNPSPDASCDPPDMLVILDRSESMSALVSNQGTRISLAMTAIDFITQADKSIRFGLQTLPAIGGAQCSTQLVVPMGLGNGPKIATTLNAMSPQLDFGTPIGAALLAAQSTLSKSKVQGRDQFVLLVTDGGECCSCNTTAYDIGVAQQLMKAGVKTFVVGFGGDDDPTLLDNLACAGHTATDFNNSCTCTQAGCTANSKATSPLYFKASDGPALKKALSGITNQTCCGCNLPPS